MPFSPDDATKHTKKATTAKLRKRWAAIANSALQKCIDGGGDTKGCDAKAIQQASGAIAKEVKEMTALQEALTKKVAGHSLKSSDFLVVEDSEKTTTWHLPVKVGGKPDRKLASAAWAALFSEGGHRGNKYDGPDKAKAKSKLKAIYKAEDWEEPKGEIEAQAQANLCEVDLEEYLGYQTDVPESYSGAITFTDLDAQRDVEGSIQEIRKDTADLWMMVDNVMWHAEITNKVEALRSLFDEYLVRIQEHLSEESEPEPPPGDEMEESNTIDLSEQSAIVSLTEATLEDLTNFDSLLSEQHVELANPRRAPVMVDFAIIKPGHGNKKDARYYPADMLERDGSAFEGVDIFVTNHDQNEKNERNKVGRFRSITGLAEQGLIGTAILYDPDMAEKARNRADAGELDTLHCSIYASGTGKKANIDGQDVTVIESITQVHSVDLVSKAGAGGHAISLTESDGGTLMDEKEKNEETQEEAPQEEALLAEVEIRESDEETPTVEGDVTTIEPPSVLSEDAVSTILTESGLDEKARAWLIGRTYQDEGAVQAAISEMQVFISELVPTAGKPFALGESAPVVDVPKLLTPEELEERAQARTRAIITKIEPTYAGNY